MSNFFFIDINCDLGEEVLVNGQPIEPHIMPLITSANIACGAHAGGETIMKMCIELALKNGVALGAHPSYPDRENFGRLPIIMPSDALKEMVMEQIGRLKLLANDYGTHLHHVKPHGALYNTAAIEIETARAIAHAIVQTDKSLIVYGPSKSAMKQAAKEYRLAFASEAFPDRAYHSDHTLVNRKHPGAVIHHPDEFIQRSLMMVKRKMVMAINGEKISLSADTLCVHGDNPAAIQLLGRLRKEFENNGIRIRKFETSHA